MLQRNICYVIPFLSLNPIFTIADDSFECGFTQCSRRNPYEFCVGPPLISESDSPYCLNCESRQELCGTDEQQAGCDLYCQDYLKENQRGNCEGQNGRDNSGDGGPTICMNRKWFIGGSVSVAGLVLILISCLGCLMCRYRRNRKENSEDDKERTSIGKEDSKSQQEEPVGDAHETSAMIPKTSAENPTGGDYSTGLDYPTGEHFSTGMRRSTHGNRSEDFDLKRIKTNPTNEDKNTKYAPS